MVTVLQVNGYLTVAEADLRAERKRLIIERVKEKFGDEATSEVAEQVAGNYCELRAYFCLIF